MVHGGRQIVSFDGTVGFFIFPFTIRTLPNMVAHHCIINIKLRTDQVFATTVHMDFYYESQFIRNVLLVNDYFKYFSFFLFLYVFFLQ